MIFFCVGQCVPSTLVAYHSRLLGMHCPDTVYMTVSVILNMRNIFTFIIVSPFLSTNYNWWTLMNEVWYLYLFEAKPRTDQWIICHKSRNYICKITSDISIDLVLISPLGVYVLILAFMPMLYDITSLVQRLYSWCIYIWFSLPPCSQ